MDKSVLTAVIAAVVLVACSYGLNEALRRSAVDLPTGGLRNAAKQFVLNKPLAAAVIPVTGPWPRIPGDASARWRSRIRRKRLAIARSNNRMLCPAAASTALSASPSTHFSPGSGPCGRPFSCARLTLQSLSGA